MKEKECDNVMDKNTIIKNIALRTGGDIYLGVVGAVRTGKSTFIKKVVENLIVPNIEDEYDRKRALDEVPQSAAGKTIMTTEPKFVPNNAAKINIDDFSCNIRLIDCVGYLIDNAKGAEDENGQHRGDGDENRPQQAHEKALGVDGVFIVGKPREGLRVGQLKGGAGGDGALHLQGVHEHHEDGVHVDDAYDGHNDAPQAVGALNSFPHCCTSLLRVTRSWIRAMATTITQKITALAWPMPRHWGPERP